MFKIYEQTNTFCPVIGYIIETWWITLKLRIVEIYIVVMHVEFHVNKKTCFTLINIRITLNAVNISLWKYRYHEQDINKKRNGKAKYSKELYLFCVETFDISNYRFEKQFYHESFSIFKISKLLSYICIKCFDVNWNCVITLNLQEENKEDWTDYINLHVHNRSCILALIITVNRYNQPTQDASHSWS